MATIGNDRNGRKRILFFDAGGKRRTIRLKATKQQAATIKLRIELLVGTKIRGDSPDDDTSRWVASIGDDLHMKLAEYGLVSKRATPGESLLATFLDSYIHKQTDKKRS